MKNGWLRLAALALVLLVGGAVFALRDPPSPEKAAPTQTASKAAPVAVPREAASDGRAAPVPERLIYEMALSQTVDVGDTRLVDDRLTARLEWMPIPGVRLVEARLGETALSGTGHELPSRRDLERAALVQLGPRGELEGVRFAARTEEPARLLLTAIFAALQHTEGDGERYQVEERDGTGTYLAAYEVSGAREVTRRKRGYVRLHEADGQMSVEGTAAFVLGADGQIESLRSRETTASHSPAFGAIRGELELSMRLVSRAPALDRALADARARAAAYEPARLVTPDGADDEALDRAMDEERAAGHTLAELRRAFAETEGSPRGGAAGQRRADLIETAGALFRVQPDAARDAGEQLGAAGVSDAEANFLAGALASAGTAEAAHALAGALGSRDATPEARRHAAVSLALSESADATTIEALGAGSRSDDPQVRNASTLALGAQARTLGGGSDGLDPVADLLLQFERASDFASKVTALAALGNSGDPRALGPIRQALAVPELAPAAAFALRFIAAPEADVLLVGLVGSGPEAVRLAAYRAAYYRDPALWMPQLRAALERETDPRCLAAIEAALARAAS